MSENNKQNYPFIRVPKALLDSPPSITYTVQHYDSEKTLQSVTEHSIKSAYVIVTYACIAYHAHYETGHAWPSIRHIAKRTGFSTATVKRAIDALESAGWLVVESSSVANTKGAKRNSYIVKLSPEAVVLPNNTTVVLSGNTELDKEKREKEKEKHVTAMPSPKDGIKSQDFDEIQDVEEKQQQQPHGMEKQKTEMQNATESVLRETQDSMEKFKSKDVQEKHKSVPRIQKTKNVNVVDFRVLNAIETYCPEWLDSALYDVKENKTWRWLEKAYGVSNIEIALRCAMDESVTPESLAHWCNMRLKDIDKHYDLQLTPEELDTLERTKQPAELQESEHFE